MLAGCGTKAVIVTPGRPVMLAEPARVRVFVKDEAGQWVEGSDRVEIPRGWVAAPLPSVNP